MRIAGPTSWLPIVLSFALAGCSSASPRDPDRTPAAEALVGPSGGDVGRDGFVVSIPAGALEADVLLRVTPAPAAPDGLGPVGAAFDLTPAGVSFAAPVTLRFPANAANRGASIFVRRLDGEPFVAVPTRTIDHELVAEVRSTGRTFVGAACRGDDCCTTPRSKLDLLLVVDDSNSMAEEQSSLREQIPRIVRAIATGDLDADGVQDRPAVDSLHVGVVTTDLGAAGYAVPTCDEPLGDDGLLRTTAASDDASCDSTYPSYQSLSLGEDSDAFVRAVSCVANAGIGGCGFEQQLEAALKALTPSGSEITFASGRGHGDLANAGFLRDDAVLAIVVLTDENDASLQDTSLVDPTSSTYSEGLNLRAFMHPEALLPVARYVDGLRALKTDPDDVILAVIAGIPADLATPGTSFETILADPRMSERIDPDAPTLMPSCVTPDRGVAFPPRRLVEAAAGFGANGIVRSICDESLAPAVDAIFDRVALRLAGACGGDGS